MNRNEIESMVIYALHEILVKHTDEECEINAETNPHKDLGIDSADGIDMACFLSARLGLTIPNDQNPLFDDKVQKWRSVKQIVQFLERCEPAPTTTHA